MELDRNRQDPEKPEKKEMPSTNSTHSLKRKKDQQQKDPPDGPEKKIYNLKSRVMSQCRPSSSDCSPFDHTTVHLRKTCFIETFYEIQNRFEKLINCNRTDVFKLTMECYKGKWGLCIDAVSADKITQLYPGCFDRKDGGKGQQYAFSIYLTDSGYEKSQDVYPDHSKKKHSEEILIEKINKDLQTKGLKIKAILIYTFNSPCLRRKKDFLCCMFQLLKSALQWESEYEICTVVGFTKLWSSFSPEYFNYLTFSDISRADSCFYTYFETCERIPFKLKFEGWREDVKNSGIYDIINCVDKKERQKLHELIGEFIKCANLSGLREEHLDCGMKKINSFSSHLISSAINLSEDDKDKVYKAHEHLIDIWKKMVENSFMSSVIEKITADFNAALFNYFVKILKSSLWYSSPLQLYEILQ